MVPCPVEASGVANILIKPQHGATRLPTPLMSGEAYGKEASTCVGGRTVVLPAWYGVLHNVHTHVLMCKY